MAFYIRCLGKSNVTLRTLIDGHARPVGFLAATLPCVDRIG